MLKLLFISVLFAVVVHARDIRARYPNFPSNHSPASPPQPAGQGPQPQQQYQPFKPSSSSAYYPSGPLDENNLEGKTLQITSSDFQYKKGAVRRRPHSSRYQNIFSNSQYLSDLPFQVIPGSEFTPRESLEPYTNRLFGHRRELFSWTAPSNVLESTFISYSK